MSGATKGSDLAIRIFVKGLNWVGDAVMATPALRLLRERMPKAHIALMVRPWVAAVYEHNPDIDSLLVHDDSASFAAFRAAVKIVHDGKFDVGIAMPNSLRAATLLKMAGVPHRYGYKTHLARMALLNHLVPIREGIESTHQVYYYLELMAALCGEFKGAPRQILAAGELEREEIAKLLGQMGLDRGQPLVGIAPGSINSTAKRWPAERFAEAADRLKAEMGAEILLIGSGKEEDVLERVAGLARSPVHNLAGKLTLGQVIALLEKLNGLITNDAGGMHLAAALRVPTAAIFGPTEYQATYPFSPTAKIVRLEDVACSPCMLRECPIPGHPCMTGIDAQRVLTAFYAALEKSADEGRGK